MAFAVFVGLGKVFRGKLWRNEKTLQDSGARPILTRYWPRAYDLQGITCSVCDSSIVGYCIVQGSQRDRRHDLSSATEEDRFIGSKPSQ